MAPSDAEQLPTISLVTPTFNQADFLEEAMRSVLDQDYPNLEYVVVDNRSTDGTIDLIRANQDRIAKWTSEADAGQYDALNKGFSETTGEIMGWLNGDDKYAPWALQTVGDIFAALPDVRWITTLFPLHWDDRGRAIACERLPGFSKRAFYRGENLPGGSWYSTGWIQQESTFWRRSLWEEAGGHLDTSFTLAADFELWARFFKYADLYGVDVPLGGFRHHAGQRTAVAFPAYAAEAERALRMHGGRGRGKISSLPPRLVNLLPLAARRRLKIARNVCVRHPSEPHWTVSTR